AVENCPRLPSRTLVHLRNPLEPCVIQLRVPFEHHERTVQWGEKLLIFDEPWLVLLANPPPYRRNVAPLHTTQNGRVRQLQSIQRIGKALGQSSPFVCRRRLHLHTLDRKSTRLNSSH